MVEQNHKKDATFKAIADPSRRQIIESLMLEDRTVTELAEPLEMTLAGASKHIGILEVAGLVARRKIGRKRVCSLQPGGLFEVRDWVEKYSNFWAEKLDCLEAAIGENPDD